MQGTNVEMHVHPFDNSLERILQAMARARLDVAVIEALDRNIFDEKADELDTAQISMRDEAGIRTKDGKYILKGREYSTRQGFQIITVGRELPMRPDSDIRRIIDSGLEEGSLVILDHPYVDNIRSRTAGHIGRADEVFLESLAREYSGQIALEWNAYCIPHIRSCLKDVLNLLGRITRYHDVNRKVERLSSRLEKEGYNVPVVADTDLHARDASLLESIGTSRVIAKLEGDSPSDILSLLKKSIFNREYENVKRYAPMSHVLRAYCIPVVLPRLFPFPRS